MKLLIQQNKFFIILGILNQIAIWSYVALMPMVLSKYYNFNESFLSYTITVFLIAYFTGMTVMNARLENKINYAKELLFAFGLMSFVVFLEGLVIYQQLSNYYFLVLRVFEGIFNANITILIGYITKSILVSHKQNGFLQSINQLISYLMKAGIPLLISVFFLISGFEIVIYWYGSFLYFTLFLFVLVYKRIFSFKYQLVLRRAQGNIQEKKTFLKSFVELLTFYKHDTGLKLHYTAIVLIQNFNRPFYDLYMVLLLMKTYDFSITMATTTITFMILGQASQIIPGFLSDRLKLDYFRLIGLIVYIVPLGVIVLVPSVFEFKYLLFGCFYLLGLGRAFLGTYDYKLQINLIKRKNKINRIGGIQQFFGELIHYVAYMLLGALLYLGVDLKHLFYIVFITVLLHFVIYLFYDKKYFKKVL